MVYTANNYIRQGEIVVISTANPLSGSKHSISAELLIDSAFIRPGTPLTCQENMNARPI